MFGLFKGRNDAAKLLSRMVGVKLGDRLAAVGCTNGDHLAAIAAGVGLSGRSVAYVPDAASGARAQKGAARAGIFVEVEEAAPTALPFDGEAFDVVVVDDTAGLFSSMRPEARVALVKESYRVLRPGGRVMVIGTGTRAGLGAIIPSSSGAPRVDPVPFLTSDGFRSARTLADRDGYTFVEALKPR